MTDLDALSALADCEHRFITTFGITDGPNRGAVTMWACQECNIRFYPACPECVTEGHRSDHSSSSLIEAARREAGLREALTRIWMMAGGGADEPRIGALQDRLLQIEDDARRALLHDNAGAGER